MGGIGGGRLWGRRCWREWFRLGSCLCFWDGSGDEGGLEVVVLLGLLDVLVVFPFFVVFSPAVAFLGSVGFFGALALRADRGSEREVALVLVFFCALVILPDSLLKPKVRSSRSFHMSPRGDALFTSSAIIHG